MLVVTLRILKKSKREGKEQKKERERRSSFIDLTCSRKYTFEIRPAQDVILILATMFLIAKLRYIQLLQNSKFHQFTIRKFRDFRI